MKPSHLHVAVRDLSAALRTFRELWDLVPAFENERMATLRFGELGLLLDRADDETMITLAFDSDDCDADYQRAVARGAVVLEPPATKPWGARAAYLQGPGRITFEIEQVLPE